MDSNKSRKFLKYFFFKTIFLYRIYQITLFRYKDFSKKNRNQKYVIGYLSLKAMKMNHEPLETVLYFLSPRRVITDEV